MKTARIDHQRIMRHLKHLTERIGHRLAGSTAEANWADYIADGSSTHGFGLRRIGPRGCLAVSVDHSEKASKTHSKILGGICREKGLECLVRRNFTTSNF